MSRWETTVDLSESPARHTRLAEDPLQDDVRDLLLVLEVEVLEVVDLSQTEADLRAALGWKKNNWVGSTKKDL